MIRTFSTRLLSQQISTPARKPQGVSNTVYDDPLAIASCSNACSFRWTWTLAGRQADGVRVEQLAVGIFEEADAEAGVEFLGQGKDPADQRPVGGLGQLVQPLGGVPAEVPVAEQAHLREHDEPGAVGDRLAGQPLDGGEVGRGLVRDRFELDDGAAKEVSCAHRNADGIYDVQ